MHFIIAASVQSINLDSSTIWYVLGIIASIATPIVWVGKKILNLEKTLDKVHYAIFNEGKTGLKNKVDQLSEDVPKIVTDIAVIKTKIEEK